MQTSKTSDTDGTSADQHQFATGCGGDRVLAVIMFCRIHSVVKKMVSSQTLALC
jgi:hypothetical protein